jgi:anti-anti-sigma factor
MNMEANFRVDRSGSSPAAVLTGRLTVDSSPSIRSALLGLICKSACVILDIDLCGVTRIDTAGLATLLEVLDTAHEQSVHLRLVGLSGQVRKLAELVQLDQIAQTLGSEVEFH